MGHWQNELVELSGIQTPPFIQIGNKHGKLLVRFISQNCPKKPSRHSHPANVGLIWKHVPAFWQTGKLQGERSGFLDVDGEKLGPLWNWQYIPWNPVKQLHEARLLEDRHIPPTES